MSVNFKDTVDLGSNRIVALGAPTSGTDATNRTWVESAISDAITAAGGLDPEAVQDIVGAMLTAGGNIDTVYDDSTGLLTISVEALTSADLTDFGTAVDTRVDGRVTGAFVSALTGVDADTLNGSTAAQIISSAQAGNVTTEEIQDIVGAMVTAGGNIDVTYNDTAGTLTIDVEALVVGDLTGLTTDTLVGRDTAGSGVAESITVGGGIEFTGAGGIRTSAFTGDVTKAAGGTATTIANNAVTNAKAAQMAANTLKGNNTAGVANAADLTVAQVKTLLALTTADLSNYATATDARIDSRVTAAFINALAGVDADTLGGSTKAQVVSDAIAGVVDAAPGTLDTLNELAAALGDDPNFATTVTNALALRVQSFATNVGDGTTTTYTITHNLNTRDVIVQIYENGDDYDQVWATVKRASVNTVTVTFSTAPTAAQYRVVVQGRA